MNQCQSYLNISCHNSFNFFGTTEQNNVSQLINEDSLKSKTFSISPFTLKKFMQF